MGRRDALQIRERQGDIDREIEVSREENEAAYIPLVAAMVPAADGSPWPRRSKDGSGEAFYWMQFVTLAGPYKSGSFWTPTLVGQPFLAYNLGNGVPTDPGSDLTGLPLLCLLIYFVDGYPCVIYSDH